MARDKETNTLELHIKGKNRRYRRAESNNSIYRFNIFYIF